MTLEIIIPHEIEKLGPEAVKVYFEALSEGKEKIPYCNLLILGEEGVGKTSLLRQLVREPFQEVYEPTRGINNETVDTVQKISIDTDKEEWAAMKDSYVNEKFTYGLAGEFMNKYQEKHSEIADDVDLVTENDLLLQLGKIRTEHSVNPEPTLQHDDEPDSGAQDTINSPTEEKIYPKPIESNEPPTNTVENKEWRTLNSMQSFIINKIVVRNKFKKKTPSVVFNVKDFAGQSIYRSMHHCFISKRGIFVVVFKLPDMLRYIQNQDMVTSNPLDVISYWIQSIHAHITPRTLPNDRERDKLKRVLLVGTRRNEVQPEGLKLIDTFIKDEFMGKKGCCINHIHLMGRSSKDKYTHFIPVENSFDVISRGEAYLKQSGTNKVQDTIKAMSKKLPYLDEDHPIKWLKLEGLLKQQRKLTTVMKIEEINELGMKSGITDKKQKELALKFFHEAGKIICMSK